VSGLLEELELLQSRQLQLQITLKVGITTEQSRGVDNTSNVTTQVTGSISFRRSGSNSAATSTKITYDEKA
jgi:hypothetical protein